MYGAVSGWRRIAAAAAFGAACLITAGSLQAAEPITIGFGMALTGGLAGGGKSALLAMQIWRDEINAKGGLLGRPVKLVYYDDQSNPATVPALYTKLLNVDKVDFIVSGYGTNQIAPAMPIAMQHDRLFFGLFGLAVNSEFHYPKYFSMLPSRARSEACLLGAVLQGRDGGQPQAEERWRCSPRIPSSRKTPPRASATSPRRTGSISSTTRPTRRGRPTSPRSSMRSRRPIPTWCSSPPIRPGRSGMLRAATETGLKTRFFGGGMVGLQFTPVKLQFGPKLNGIVDYDWWIPAQTMQFPGILDFLKTYQAKAPGGRGRSARLVFAAFRLRLSAGTGRCDRRRQERSTRTKSPITSTAHPFKTIVGDITFGKDGEWSKPRVLEVQWQGIKGNTLDEFKDTKTEVDPRIPPNTRPAR